MVYYNTTFPRVIHTRQQCSHVEKVPVQGREGGVFVAEETQLVVEETQEDTGYVEGLHHCSRTQSDGGRGERNHIWLTNTSVHTMADIVYDAKTTEVSYRLLHMKIRAIQITR